MSGSFVVPPNLQDKFDDAFKSKKAAKSFITKTINKLRPILEVNTKANNLSPEEKGEARRHIKRLSVELEQQ
jgi:hypothetical protein